jgi:hypothetical protein
MDGRGQARILSYLLALGSLQLLSADTMISYTGTLASPEDTAIYTVTLTGESNLTLQTWGFGGGTNAADQTIEAGGTDPFVAVFAGTGDTASILTDGIGDPYGTSLALSNYGNPDFMGCPPAGTVNIGGSDTCGDITMTIPTLAAGMYTVVLSDGNYIAGAVFDDGTLGEGFADLTGGAFCNLLINEVGCPSSSGAYAIDIDVQPAVSSVGGAPEPGALSLFGIGLVALGGMAKHSRIGKACERIPK